MSRDDASDLTELIELTQPTQPGQPAQPGGPRAPLAGDPGDPCDPGDPWDPHAEVLDAATAGHADHADHAGHAEPSAQPVAPTRPRRWRVLPRTLAGRLVFGVVGLVVALVVSISAATYFALHSFLINRLDQQLDTVAAPTVASAVNCLIGLETDPAATCQFGGGRFRNPQKEWLTILDSNQRLLSARLVPLSDDFAVLDISQATAERVSANRTHSTVTTASGESVRVTARSLPSGGTVLVGLSTNELNRTLHRLVLLELGIGTAAVVLAFLATAYGVRWSLRPLKRVTNTAREVTAELSPDGAGLDRRVPVTTDEADTEVGQVAESVNTLLGAVETQFAARLESEQRMRQFLADASHELRTPLTSIRGYAELARMRRAQAGAGADSQDADTLDRIESEGTRMSRLVDDLLTLARSDRGVEPQHDPIDVGGLIDDAVQGARAAHPQRQIDVVVPTPLSVRGDRDQLLRVLRNLVTNAAVHTRPDGPIRVTARIEGAEAVLRVDDSGPGLPPEEAAHVFERFWRADKARSRAKGGSGLGLAIVASIVEAHGGTVRFDSAVETGSTVTVRLPLEAPGTI